MLFALPDSYSALCTILNSTPTTNAGLSLSADIVITQVLTEEKNTKLGSLQIALVAHTRSKGKPQSSKLSDGDKKKMKCNEGVIQLFKAEILTSQKDMLSKWIVDSGASTHMSSQQKWFIIYKRLLEPH